MKSISNLTFFILLFFAAQCSNAGFVGLGKIKPKKNTEKEVEQVEVSTEGSAQFYGGTFYMLPEPVEIVATKNAAGKINGYYKIDSVPESATYGIVRWIAGSKNGEVELKMGPSGSGSGLKLISVFKNGLNSVLEQNAGTNFVEIDPEKSVIYYSMEGDVEATVDLTAYLEGFLLSKPSSNAAYISLLEKPLDLNKGSSLKKYRAEYDIPDMPLGTTYLIVRWIFDDNFFCESCRTTLKIGPSSDKMRTISIQEGYFNGAFESDSAGIAFVPVEQSKTFVSVTLEGAQEGTGDDNTTEVFVDGYLVKQELEKSPPTITFLSFSSPLLENKTGSSELFEDTISLTDVPNNATYAVIKWFVEAALTGSSGNISCSLYLGPGKAKDGEMKYIVWNDTNLDSNDIGNMEQTSGIALVKIDRENKTIKYKFTSNIDETGPFAKRLDLFLEGYVLE